MKSSHFILVFLLAPVFGLGQNNHKPELIKDTAAFLEELGKVMRDAVIEDYQPSKSKDWMEMSIPFSIKKTAAKPVVKKKGK